MFGMSDEFLCLSRIWGMTWDLLIWKFLPGIVHSSSESDNGSGYESSENP